jgi:pilus assembly protein Flp/PilA
MNKLLKKTNRFVRAFAKDEEGAQVVEYALIIAVVSIGLIVLLGGIKGTDFSGFITRVKNCLGTSVACA